MPYGGGGEGGGPRGQIPGLNLNVLIVFNNLKYLTSLGAVRESLGIVSAMIDIKKPAV